MASDEAEAMSQEEEMCLERSDLYVRRGFTTIAMAANDSIERLVALRRGDYDDVGEKGRTRAPLYLVEVYNTVSMPMMFLEKCVPIQNTCAEAVAWLESNIFVACVDGSIIAISPFTPFQQRFQVCASAIVAIVPLSSSRLLLGTKSSELLTLKYSENADDAEASAWRKRSIMVQSSIKFSQDEKIISLAVSDDSTMAAAGMINAVYVVNVRTGAKLCVEVPRHGINIIIWSVLFIRDILFTGDSRGKVTLYDPKSGAVLKIISSHQADVLTLATNGDDAYASGVDYRIQVLGAHSQDRRFGWATVGQRLFHTNDVRAMACVGEKWLVSGGAEHDVFISNKYSLMYHPIPKRACSASMQSELVLMCHPQFLELWLKPNVALPASVSVGPKKLARINSAIGSSPPAANSFIADATISPDGHHIVLLDSSAGLTLLRLRLMDRDCIPEAFLEKVVLDDEDDGEESGDDHDEGDGEDGCGDEVTALTATNQCVYYSIGKFSLRRLDFGTLKRRTVAKKRSGGSIRRLYIDDAERFAVALSTTSRVYRIAFADTSSNANETEATVKRLNVSEPIVDCAFIDDSRLVLLCAGLESQIVIFDFASNEVLRAFGREQLQLGYKEFLCYLSDVSGAHSLVATSNKGDYRVLVNLDKESPAMMMSYEREEKRQGAAEKRKSGEDGNPTEASSPNKIPRKLNQWTEPFWSTKQGQSKPEVGDGSGILLVGQVPLAPPTQVPMRIRRYDRN